MPIPVADADARSRRIDVSPVPVLRLQALDTHGNRGWRDYSSSYTGGHFDVALPVFCYQDVEIKPDDIREFSTLPDGETVCVLRRYELEKPDAKT